MFRGGGDSLAGGKDASACRNSLPLPPDLGNERGGVSASAGWAGGADFIQNRLWALTAKLEVESGGRALSPYPPLTRVPLQGGTGLVGLL